MNSYVDSTLHAHWLVTVKEVQTFAQLLKQKYIQSVKPKICLVIGF